MEVVKPVDLGKINRIRIENRSRHPLMSRHMKRIKIAFGIGFQRQIQPGIFFLVPHIVCSL